MIAFTKRRVLLSGSAALAVAFAGHAQAQTTPPTPSTTGTPAGTPITNTAKATYTVNGTPQETNSNEAAFVVDRKVNLTVVRAQPADTQVNLGETGAVTVFRVTNTTNATQDFLLDPDQNIGTVVYVGTDNFNMTGLQAFVDADGDNLYNPDIDKATFIDELAPDQTRTVFLVGNVPDEALARLAIVNLHVTVAAGGQKDAQGAPLVQTTLNVLNDDATVDVVFADNDSDGIGRDVLRDGQARAYLAYEVGVRTVNLTVNKSSRILSDNVDPLFPKALPGAVVEYCLAVRNATPLTPATGVTLTDLIPANTTYVRGSISIGGVGGTCVLNGQSQDDDADDAGDGGLYRGSYDEAARRVTAIIPTLPGGVTLNASFQVTIN